MKKMLLVGVLLMGLSFAVSIFDDFTAREYYRAECSYGPTRALLQTEKGYCNTPDTEPYRLEIRDKGLAARDAAFATNDCFDGSVDMECLRAARRDFMMTLKEYYSAVGAGRVAFWAFARDAFSSCAEPASTIAGDYGDYYIDCFTCSTPT
jgi:hypothetical protein